jgi:hypothetical protein
MSNESTEATPPPNGTAAGATPAAEGASAKTARVREAVTALKRHPLGVVALAGAAVALVEVEVAVGILAGIGATALLVTKSGPEARQEVLSKGNEVLAKGKLALAKAKVKLASRTKPASAETKSPEPPAAPSAAAA